MKIIVKYSVPAFSGYSAQTKVFEGNLFWRLTLGGNCLHIKNLDNGIEYLFSVALMPLVEIIPDEDDDVPDDDVLRMTRP